MNSQFLDALNCQNRFRPPIWIMRQAGRYLPEYRKLRETYSFMELCREPELAAAVTLMPIKRFEFDAAILFSDILVVPDALGSGLQFTENQGPVLERPVRSVDDIVSLKMPEVEEALGYVAGAIKEALFELKVPLIGFCGGPFTVASYMIEGGTSRDLKKTKQWMLRNPKSFHLLLDHITNYSIKYLNLQIDAGVHAIQLFESWGCVLGIHHFREFVLHYLVKIMEGIRPACFPVIVFSRGSAAFVKDLAAAKPTCIGLDWSLDLAQGRPNIPKTIAVQGNLDPDVLYAPDSVIKKETTRLLEGMRGDKGYIFNLGHGIKPDVTVKAVEQLVETVKRFQ